MRTWLNWIKHFLAQARAPRILLSVDKRVRFVTATLGLCALMLVATFSTFDAAWIFLPILLLASYLAIYFSILEGLEGIEWLMLFIMPVALTLAFYIFYFLFPVRWLTRIPFIAIYGVSIYATLLTSNILNVGVERNLQLYRAAFSVNYFYQTVLIFLSLNVLFSLKANFLINFVGVSLIVFPIALQMLWSIQLKLQLERAQVLYAFFVSYILATTALALSFVAFEASIFALILTAGYYSLIGIIYSYLDARLFKETVRGYLFVLGFVGVIAVLTLRW